MSGKKLNSVQEFYKDKTIFITGGSGFMGKVLIEKLLYSCSDLKQIIMLMRNKRGKTAQMRIYEFEALPMFERIMNEKPAVMNKIYPVWGDISEPNFGLNAEHMKHVIDNTNIIFHLAASLKLEAPLKINVTMNLESVKQMCDIAKQMKNLLIMIHSSTAFCIVEHDVIEEKVYDVNEDPLNVIESTKQMSSKDLAAIQKQRLGQHLNTYTYTKRLSEVLVRDEFKRSNLPVCIVRPSMVCPALAEPLPGWVDSLNGSPGVIIAAGRGVLRCMLMDMTATKNFIPVDLCMNGYILAAKDLGSAKERPEDIKVYNLTTHESNTITLGKFFEVVDNMKKHCPLSFGIWYPKVTITQNKLLYYFSIILFQWIPALLVDFLLMIFGQKRFMIKVQKKLFTGMEVLKCFLLYNWIFKTSNFDNLLKTQSDEEYKTFFIDTKKIEPKRFFESCVIGGRVYLGKDPISTIPRARILYKIQYVIHLLAHALFFYWITKKFLIFTNLLDPVMGFVNNAKGLVASKF
ncbi:fatty acyl-CoA reductase 1-like [Chironomus tepperi]|uniref:fatty acyl-CoA reductase 1-like n=1 Tax=Chironomus tepperi TaxID=113505 RepID=UPI00391F8634